MSMRVFVVSSFSRVVTSVSPDPSLKASLVVRLGFSVVDSVNSFSSFTSLIESRSTKFLNASVDNAFSAISVTSSISSTIVSFVVKFEPSFGGKKTTVTRAIYLT